MLKVQKFFFFFKFFFLCIPREEALVLFKSIFFFYHIRCKPQKMDVGLPPPGTAVYQRYIVHERALYFKSTLLKQVNLSLPL